MSIDPAKLKEIYQSRPDLQKYYSPEGVAINANLPEIQQVPTLEAWALKYGLKEYPELDTTVQTLLDYFSLDEIKSMPQDIRTGLAAFGDVQKKNFEMGKVNAEINAQTWQDAMNEAQRDPVLNAKYGDELALATTSVGRALQTLDQGFTMEQAKIARDQELETQRLAETEAAAGRAFSGFRQQAENRLKTDQNDVIKSTRMKFKQGIQSLVTPFETRYGTGKLDRLNTDLGEEKYDPVNGITGTFDQSKKNEQKALAADFYEASELPTNK